MLTRFVRAQLIIFTIASVIGITAMVLVGLETGVGIIQFQLVPLPTG